MSFLQNIVSSVFERGRFFSSVADSRKIDELCRAILSERGEVSGGKLAASILAKFDELSLEEQKDFFHFLLENFDVDPDQIEEASQSYKVSRSPEDLRKLTHQLYSKNRELLRRINQTPGGTYRLVKMREVLLSLIPDDRDLARLDIDFEYLFSSWFNRGFLVLQPIDWTTPANILEKIIEYEAVHTINDWDDLRRRLQPEDRRCFAFFHPAMPDEPLIFVEVALTEGVPTSVNKLLAENRDALNPSQFNTAVFYSISNCQKGLKGVSFGNFLIKQVVNDLSVEFRNLKNFVTLSPIPGFRKWLDKQIALDPENPTLTRVGNVLTKTDANHAEEDLASHEKTMRILLAKYFLEGKAKNGWALDPVARFHLGNGASLSQFNWMADASVKGFEQSASMMVNYKYDLATLEQNHESYVNEKTIHTTREINSLARSDLK